jgi:hypothetical protein
VSFRRLTGAPGSAMVNETHQDTEEPAMTWLLYNIPLMVLFFALWVGIPLWLVARRPDTGPSEAAPAAVSYLPAERHEDHGDLLVA